MQWLENRIHYPPVVDEITIDINLFDTAVGTQDLVKVEPIETRKLKIEYETTVTIGNVTNSKNQKIEVKNEEPDMLDAPKQSNLEPKNSRSMAIDRCRNICINQDGGYF